jgi:DNA polymerase III subunit beta
MKLTINTKELADRLSSVQGAISSKPTIQILNNVKLDAVDNQLNITASDLAIWNFTDCGAEVKENGSLAVNARKLLNILKMTNTEKVDIVSDGFNMILKSGKSKTVIYGLPASEYPNLDSVEYLGEFTIDSQVFGDALNHVSYAVCVDQTRPSLAGVYTLLSDKSLTMVTTDGKRLAKYACDKIKSDASKLEAIVPVKIMSEISKLGGELKISIGETHIKAESSSGLIVAKLIEGTFPNYKQVMPKSFSGKVSLNESDLSNCVSRASAVIDSSQSLSLDIKGSLVEVFTECGSESFSDFLECSSSNDIKLAFNPYFLSQGLKSINSNVVEISYNDSVSPIKLTGDEGFVYILMPMRK